MINVLKNSGRLVLGLAVAVALSVASHASAAETGKVTGKVLDKDGKGVAGATVQLRAPAAKADKPAAAAAADDAGKEKAKPAKPVAKGTTDSDGAFTLADVPAGDYVLNARLKGQGAAREKITVKAGETKEVSLTLKEAKAGGKKAK